MARAFFCSKVTGAPPFHDVLQLIVIDYYYHAVVMLSCISDKSAKKEKSSDEQKILFNMYVVGMGDGGIYAVYVMGL